MEISEMNLTEINERMQKLDEEVRNMNSVDEIHKAMDERDALNKRKAELEPIEARKNAAQNLTAGIVSGTVIENTHKEERKMDREYRNSEKYINAFADYIKTEDDKEVRKLMTENADDGTIAVPDMVYDIVKTAWDKNEIMSRVQMVNIAGNLKVQFEISGTDAVVHEEGGDAVTEETLVEGIVTIIPAFVKKWISVSDEVMAMRGDAFLDYIYRELTYRITKKVADLLVAKIAALPSTATSTSPAAAAITTAPAVGTVAEGIANLSDEADNPVIIMNKLTWAAFKAEQYDNNYAVDPFEGLPVLFNNSLPAYSSATAGAVYMIVGDLGHGAIANFPLGQTVSFIFDEKARKKEDLVEILGKEYVGTGVVANKAFTLVKKPTT